MQMPERKRRAFFRSTTDGNVIVTANTLAKQMWRVQLHRDALPVELNVKYTLRTVGCSKSRLGNCRKLRIPRGISPSRNIFFKGTSFIDYAIKAGDGILPWGDARAADGKDRFTRRFRQSSELCVRSALQQ
ncbi:hypothetical protein PUN28_018023 [Cardiocondyla obscurior]|uniref:Uncharacterized protein n=1 Tax=Cardiocondyla obscurior TaxID=286306 RepID=A0AAW2EK02_9HYME